MQLTEPLGIAAVEENLGDRILFWVPGGMPLLLEVEMAIAKALQSRGVEVHAVICNGVYRACVLREEEIAASIEQWGAAGTSETGLSCKECARCCSEQVRRFAVDFSGIGDFISSEERQLCSEKANRTNWDDLDRLHHCGVPIGNNVKSAIFRYLKGMPLSLDNRADLVREYAFTAMVSATAMQRAIRQFKPKTVVMSHGTYADWGPALRVAFAHHVPVVGWQASYLLGRFYLRHVEEYERLCFLNINKDAWPQVVAAELAENQLSRLNTYLDNRYLRRLSFDMPNLPVYKGDRERLLHKYDLSADRPVWGVFTHINWDVVMDSSPMAYATLDDWLLDSVREIINITDVQWLIKIHPAECHIRTLYGVHQLIRDHFPQLPPHVKIVASTENCSPLEFLQLISGMVTVYGTAGLELLVQGKPVILAGEAHYGGKGFTCDGLTPESYRHLLRRAATLPPLNAEQLMLAKKYAYCYFIQRQVPLPVVYKPGADWWEFQPQKAHLLEPGQDPFTDFICERILDGQDFIMPEELVQLAEQLSESERVLVETMVEQPSSSEGVSALLEQASQAIVEGNLSRAQECFTKVLAEHAASLEPAMRDEVQRWTALLGERLTTHQVSHAAPGERQ